MRGQVTVLTKTRGLGRPRGRTVRVQGAAPCRDHEPQLLTSCDCTVTWPRGQVGARATAQPALWRLLFVLALLGRSYRRGFGFGRGNRRELRVEAFLRVG